MGKTGLLCLFFLLLFSCAKNKEVKRQSLYAIDSILNKQAKYLSDNNATLTKVTSLGKRNGKVSITPKGIVAWKKELEIFGALDAINKAVNRDLYHTENSLDDKSNLSIKSFTTQETLPVKYLKVYYHNTLDEVRKIEAQYNESNSLYESVRALTMEFQQINNEAVLTSYSIVGGQKMLMEDTVQYNINAFLTISR